MNTVTWVQILDMAVYVSFRANTLWKKKKEIMFKFFLKENSGNKNKNKQLFTEKQKQKQHKEIKDTKTTAQK